jgi:asparagine synthase (glutamine-hydrolysing)
MSSIFGIIYKSGKPVSSGEATAITLAVQQGAVAGSEPWVSDNVLIGQYEQAAAAGLPCRATPLVTAEMIVAADVCIHNREYILRHTGADKHSTDQQLLLYAFRQWGALCLHHLEGEYAFCIWEQALGRFFLATDHVGFRPLYYYDDPDVFIFSSTMQAVLAVKPLPHVFNAESLIAYHFRQSDPNLTYTREVYAFCGGNYLTIEGHTVRMLKYWHPSPGKYKFNSLRDCTDALRQLMCEAVRNRICRDRPVGITLSGGLDSSSIAALLARELELQNKPLYAFSSVLPEQAPGTDERAYIALMHRRFPNIIQTYVHAPDIGPFEHILTAFSHDETFPNAFFYMDHAILRAAAEKGIGALFTGYGGDHWVSWQGNPVIYNMFVKGDFQDAFEYIMSFAENEKRHPLQIAKRELAAHTMLYRTLRGQQRKTISSTALQRDFIRKYKRLLNFRPVRDIGVFMKENIVSGRTGQFPAMLAGRNSVYGMSSAVPLLDRAILELMLDMPDHVFIHKGHKRSLIRHTMDGLLPDEIVWRRDKGMYSPDFMQRITGDLAKAAEVTNAADHGLVFDRYLCKSAISRLSQGNELSVIRMTQGVICSMIITALQKKGYIFDDNFS